MLERVEALRPKMQLHTKVNRVQGVSKADSMVVDVLSGFHRAGLAEKTLVIDANALFCYEIAPVDVLSKRLTPHSQPASCG